MQVRKLIRLLSEMVEKDPSIAYKEACIDTELGKDNHEHFKYYSIGDVEEHWCVWNQEESVNEIQRKVIVLGNL